MWWILSCISMWQVQDKSDFLSATYSVAITLFGRVSNSTRITNAPSQHPGMQTITPPDIDQSARSSKPYTALYRSASHTSLTAFWNQD